MLRIHKQFRVNFAVLGIRNWDVPAKSIKLCLPFPLAITVVIRGMCIWLPLTNILINRGNVDRFDRIFRYTKCSTNRDSVNHLAYNVVSEISLNGRGKCYFKCLRDLSLPYSELWTHFLREITKVPLTMCSKKKNVDEILTTSNNPQCDWLCLHALC